MLPYPQVDGEREEMERMQRGHSAGSRMFDRIQQTNPALYQQLCSIGGTGRGGRRATSPPRSALGKRRGTTGGATEAQPGPVQGCREKPPEQS